jgi:cystathionine beta-lyase/cystathionine gamma-synthase
MAAITSAILSQVKAGDRIAAQREVYGGTFEFLNALAPTLGLEVVWFSGTDDVEYSKALESKPALVYLETPTNPLLRCVDLRARAEAARAVGAVTIVDSTFGTPFNQRPLDLGIDIVVHSATKYLAGHTDLLAGCVLGPAEMLKSVWKYRKLLGGIIDPQAAFLLERSLRTFAVRMEVHNRNGKEIALFLDKHPFVERVYYPGLPDHPDHAVARSQMKGFGGMVTVTLKTDLAGVIRFAESLELFRLAASLGGVESLVSIPATSSHFALTAEERETIGVPDGMARLSLGIEEARDLIRDLEQALQKAQGASVAATASRSSTKRIT